MKHDYEAGCPRHNMEYAEYQYTLKCSGDVCDIRADSHTCGDYIRRYEHCETCGEQTTGETTYYG